MAGFGSAIFLGAFLLFQVEPLIGKRILPWFGGSPAVWTTALLFFQVALLLGYMLAHGIVLRLRPRLQVALYLLLLLVTLPFLPVYPSNAWKPISPDAPALRILILLAANVGLPFVLLSCASPLIQSWLVLTGSSARVYRLYALSNVASMLALVTYPTVVEPHFALLTQARIWSALFVIYALFAAYCGLKVWRSPAANAPEGSAAHPESAPEKITLTTKLLWVLLPACASMMLLAMTNQISEDMTVVPFLWVLPLAIYLLSFIICFDNDRWYFRPVFWPLLVAAVVAAGFLPGYFSVINVGAAAKLVTYCLILFVLCMVCHGETVRLKPSPRRLTLFYLMISAGGALGGLFVSIIAPLIFTDYVEFPVGIWLSCAASFAALLIYLHKAGKEDGRAAGFTFKLLVGIGCVALLAAMAMLFRPILRNARLFEHTERNFYGVLRMRTMYPGNESKEYRVLEHGKVTHGLQLTNPQLCMYPTSYYGPDSGICLALENFPRKSGMRVGVIGLGAGTIAAYGQPGDDYRFYDINPKVINIAQTRFTFLKGSGARCEIIPGDARLSLEREPDQHFDVLVLDAFSGDSIPAHLLTTEAFDIYTRHLNPDGIIAVHISNQYIDLLPIVLGQAVTRKLDAVFVEREAGESDDEYGYFGSTWVLLTKNEDFLALPEIESRIIGNKTLQRAIVWTDDFTSVFNLVTWRRHDAFRAVRLPK